jgi:hypothetical protein
MKSIEVVLMSSLDLEDALSHNIGTNLECLEVVLLSSLDLEDALINWFFGLFTPHAHRLAL